MRSTLTLLKLLQSHYKKEHSNGHHTSICIAIQNMYFEEKINSREFLRLKTHIRENQPKHTIRRNWEDCPYSYYWWDIDKYLPRIRFINKLIKEFKK